MQFVGVVISWAVAISIIGIGIGYAAKSEMNATGFGLKRARAFPGSQVQVQFREARIRAIGHRIYALTANVGDSTRAFLDSLRRQRTFHVSFDERGRDLRLPVAEEKSDVIDIA